MDAIIYLLLAIGYLALFIMGVILAKNHGWMSAGNVVLIVTLALFYDNAILATGKYIGEGELLRGLNEARYWMHALFTPLLVIFSWHTLARTDMQWAKKGIVQLLFILFTITLIVVEITTSVWNISLESAFSSGVLRYEKVGSSSSIMIMGVSITLLLVSIIIWWKEKWLLFFLGVLFMGIVSMLQSWITIGALTNVGEFVLLLALLATKAHQDRKLENTSYHG